MKRVKETVGAQKDSAYFKISSRFFLAKLYCRKSIYAQVTFDSFKMRDIKKLFQKHPI